MANANIFQQYLQPVRSVQDYAGDLDRRDMARLQLENTQGQNALLQLTRQQQAAAAQQGIAKQNRLQQLAAVNSDPAAFEAALLSDPLTMDVGEQRRKARLDAERVQAQTGKDVADAGKTAQETADAAVKRFRGALDFIDTPQGAARWLQAQYSDPILGKHMQALGPLEQALANIPGDPQSFQQWREKSAMGMEAYAKKVQDDLRIAETGRSNRATETISVENNKRTVGATIRGQNMTDARAKELNSITREAQQTQVINDPERGVLLVNKGTKQVQPGVGPDGKPLVGETAVKRANAAKRTLPLLDEADKLIDEATGSYLGAGADLAARAVGVSTGGADAVAKLKVLEGNLMMAQPRMEGPQSDKDTMLYRQMAGQIGDPTVPRDMKKAALAQIRALQERYAGAPATAQPITDFTGFQIVNKKP